MLLESGYVQERVKKFDGYCCVLGSNVMMAGGLNYPRFYSTIQENGNNKTVLLDLWTDGPIDEAALSQLRFAFGTLTSNINKQLHGFGANKELSLPSKSLAELVLG